MHAFREKHGISIKAINLCFVVIIILFSCGVLMANYLIEKKYNETTVLQKTMMACNDAANTLQSESDELTMCINNYVDNATEESMRQYYTVIDNKLREKEIKKAEKYNVDCTALREALKLSDELAERETHAFKLISMANETLETAPIQVKNYVLPQDEEALSAKEKETLAKRLIHGSAYNIYKRAIYQKIDVFQKEILAKTEEDLMNENKSVARCLRYLRFIALFGVFMVIHMSVVLYRKVTVVLGKYIRAMSENRYVEESGTQELKYLGRVFNSGLALQNERQEELRLEAEVDTLTRAASRRATESFMQKKLQQKELSGAFVFVDADNFKAVNDTYGHNIGDALLKQLVQEMMKTFGVKDFIGRIGGDEFAVWLEGVTPENVKAICSKIDGIQAKCLLPDGEEIAVCVSAGLTFCKAGDSYDAVLKRADAALYQKKRSGKRGCAVYEELL